MGSMSEWEKVDVNAGYVFFRPEQTDVITVNIDG